MDLPPRGTKQFSMTLYKCIQPENVTVKQARQFSHVGLVRSTMNNAQAKHCSFRTEPHHKKSTMPKNNRPHGYVLSKVTCRNLKCEAFVVCKRVGRWPIRSDPIQRSKNFRRWKLEGWMDVPTRRA